ncbi:MAG: EamA family transporter [Desulfobacter sp.]|nr:MAG: EamA family transporter [Desulfobacter sp.]
MRICRAVWQIFILQPLLYRSGPDLFCRSGPGSFCPCPAPDKTDRLYPQSPCGFYFPGYSSGLSLGLFFLAIQVSSVAVGLITFSSFPLFVTFMEPVFFKEPLKSVDMATALAVFTGIILVVPDLDLSNQTTLGAFYGILSGLTFALLALVNRKNGSVAKNY